MTASMKELIGFYYEQVGAMMDIFTTQLTRVVQTPIKPANLKVKALLKDAATGKLKEDPEHLENHDNYFDTTKDNQSKNSKKKQTEETSTVQKEEHITETSDKTLNDDGKPDVHLDLYV